MKNARKPARGSLHLVGVGPGDESMITLGALRAIEDAEEVWMQTLGSVNFEKRYIRRRLAGKKTVNISDYYQLPNVRRLDFYELTVQRLLHLASIGRRITFLLPGNPLFWAYMTGRLKHYADQGLVDLRITTGMSFLDVIALHAPFDIDEFQLRIGGITDPDVSPEIACIVGQVGDQDTNGTGLGKDGLFTGGLSGFCRDVERLYPASHRVFLSGHDPVQGQELHRLTTVAELPATLPLFERTQFCVLIPGLKRDRAS